MVLGVGPLTSLLQGYICLFTIFLLRFIILLLLILHMGVLVLGAIWE